MNPENRPLFSVIVPVYKVEKYIHQCLDSILAQSFSDFELILVDDGSPDACGRICDEYAAKDSRIKVIHKENGGLVSARRAGYSISRGSYICSIDSDDYVATDLLEKAAEKISDYSVDAVLFGYEYFNEYSGEKHLPKVGSGLYDGEKMETIRKNLIFGENARATIFYNLCMLVMRKERMDPYFASFPETICRGEDMAVTVPALSQCASVYVLEECLYHYRITPGSLQNSHKGTELDQALTLADYLSERMGEAYHQRLHNYVLLECFDHLTHYRGSRQEYRQEVLRMRNKRLIKHLRGARCGKETSFPNRVVFFLLRHQMFNVLWLIWWIKS